jgi:hypothetical protein
MMPYEEAYMKDMCKKEKEGSFEEGSSWCEDYDNNNYYPDAEDLDKDYDDYYYSDEKDEDEDWEEYYNYDMDKYDYYDYTMDYDYAYDGYYYTDDYYNDYGYGYGDYYYMDEYDPYYGYEEPEQEKGMMEQAQEWFEDTFNMDSANNMLVAVASLVTVAAVQI